MIAHDLAPGWVMGTINVISFLILLYFSALQLVLYTRITSYNVCYTKLLHPGRSRPGEYNH